MSDLLARGRRATVISIGFNGLLALIKLVTGIIGHSYALVADAVESLSDLFGSAVVWGGLAIAWKPADEDHPYGHGKAEPLASLAVAAMLIGAAIGIAIQAVRSLSIPHPAPRPYTLAVLLVVIGIKEGMYRYLSRQAKRIGSSAVGADAWHHRSDALTSAAAAIGITVALIGGERFVTADEWAALAACVVIAGTGLRFARGAVDELMDVKPDTTLSEGVIRAASQVQGARGIEKLFLRKMGPHWYVDLHLEVDPDQTVRKAHQIAHAVKDRIRSQFPHVADVLIHVEPHHAGSDQPAFSVADGPHRPGGGSSGSSTHTTPSRTSQ